MALLKDAQRVAIACRFVIYRGKLGQAGCRSHGAKQVFGSHPEFRGEIQCCEWVSL